MAKRSENFELVLLAGVLGLVWIANNVFGNLVYGVLKTWLEQYTRASEAEVIAGLSQVFFALVLGVGIVWGIYRYIHRELAKDFEPKLECSFDTNDPHCKRPVTLQTGPGDFYRIRVDALSPAPALHCEAILLDIFNETIPVLHGETLRLSFALSTNPFDKTISKGTPAFIDILAIDDQNEARLALSTLDGFGSVNMANLFRQPGDYSIRVAVNSTNAGQASGVLKFKWENNRKTAELKWQETPQI